MSKKSNSKTPSAPPKQRPAAADNAELEKLVAEYENSPEGKAALVPKPESKGARLTKLFYQTPEGKEFRDTVDSINRDLNEDDTVRVEVRVPRQLIRLVEFVEEKRVKGSKVPPSPADEALTRILVNNLQEQLHWLVVSPGTFSGFRELWNRFCDEQGAPEEKIADPAEKSAQDTEEGPF